MFESIGQHAERVAKAMSRREYLGRLGRGALTVAAALGGILSFPAGSQGETYICPAGSNWHCEGVPEGASCAPYSVCKRVKHSDICACVCIDKRHCL